MTDLSEREIYESATPGGPEPSHQPEPSPRDTVPAEQERPTPNLGQIESGDEGSQQQPEGQQAAPQEPQKRGMLDDLRSERQKRQDYERQLAERDRQLAERDGAMRQMQAMLQQMQGRQAPQAPQAPQQPEEVPDPFMDPQGFAAHQARQVFEQQFGPFAQQFQQREQMLQRTVQGLQRSAAVTQYGQDEARAAEEAFNTAAARNAIPKQIHEMIQQADNPYAAAVEWHRREKALTTTGGDPQKWFENEFQRRLREDPAFQQQAFGLLQGQAQQAAGTNVPAAGRPAPVFAGLPSLNATAGTSGQQASGPIGEADIFNAAPSKMGGRS